MTSILFFGVIASLLFSNVLLVVSIVRPDLRFWPPPDLASWRYRLVQLNGVLGPLTVMGILVLGVLDWNSWVWSNPARFVPGCLLFAVGGGFALWGYLGLGARASQGRNDGLVADGAYRYSRNPQYVGAIVCFLGYAIACNSSLTFAGWALWSAWFLMAPFAEEPWLRDKLGRPYEAYMAIWPRSHASSDGARDDERQTLHHAWVRHDEHYHVDRCARHASNTHLVPFFLPSCALG